MWFKKSKRVTSLENDLEVLTEELRALKLEVVCLTELMNCRGDTKCVMCGSYMIALPSLKVEGSKDEYECTRCR